jgi:flagellar biosynthetic protein FliR
MILNCVLGVMAKVAPQMNMFSIGMQLKVLVGFAVLFLTIFMLPGVADSIFSEMKTMVKLIAEGMY